MTPILIGTALALIVLAFVLFPLFQAELAPRRVVAPRSSAAERSTTAIDALREIEFDHATGKLSEHDYAELKASYTQRAVAAMRGSAADVIICEVCGPRPEAEAMFCSECGRQLTT
jgi:hypothetical protein